MRRARPNLDVMRRPAASAANRGRRVKLWIEAAERADGVAATLERAGELEGAAFNRRVALQWTELAAQEAKWAAHYAGVALRKKLRNLSEPTNV